MHIRAFREGDDALLLAVFRSAIHKTAAADYTAEQILAWAPRDMDLERWHQRISAIRPFVVDHDGVPVAYADLQNDGYIDHFFVAGEFSRQGIGSLLMTHILANAANRQIAALTSHVSLTAQPFFLRFGFLIVERRSATINGVTLANALMRKDL